MIVPNEFHDLARWFYQGADRQFSTMREWASYATKHLDARQGAIVKAFLTDLLNGNHTAAELQRIWDSSPADYFVADDGELRELLAMLRDEIS